MAKSIQFETIFRVLQNHGVEYILIGGVCAALHGSTTTTGDVDIVPARTQDNLNALSAALTELHSYYREHPPFRILPTAERLDTAGHHLLMTDAGPIDVLGSIVGGRDFATLRPDTVTVAIDDLRICMLDLPKLIEVKRDTGRRKDIATLPILEELLKLRTSASDTD